MITLIDGGMGRALHERGVSLDAPLWSARAFLGDPDLIKQAHLDYIQAGATVITTNSYALTDYYLGRAGLLGRKQQMLEQAYQIADQARTESGLNNIRIAGSIPPLNESYRPDLVQPDQLEREYPLLIQAAASNGADLLLAETLSSITEAESVLTHAHPVEIPLWVSFTVSADGTLRSGESVRDAARLCMYHGADAVLLNCSTPAAITTAMNQLAGELRGTDLKFGGYANRFREVSSQFTLEGGLNELNTGLSCASYTETVSAWIDLGATIVGGCCGMGPDYIRTISNNFSES